MKTVATTVGTSLFINYAKRNPGVIEEQCEDLEHKPYSEWDKNETRIGYIRKKVGEWLESESDASAEISSIRKIQEVLSEEIDIYLLASDTVLSVLAASILQEYFVRSDAVKVRKDQVRWECIRGLQVTDRKEFERRGLTNLVEKVYEIAGGDANNEGYFGDMILNITGGFKGTIPYMTILGLINNIPIYYMFEDTNELIKIPQVPINVDWSIFALHKEFLSKLDKEGIENWNIYKREHCVAPELASCTWEDDDCGGLAELNAMGRILWRRFNNYILVRVAKSSEYMEYKPGNRNEVNAALKELYQRLENYLKGNFDSEIHEYRERGISQGDLQRAVLSGICKLGNKHDLTHGGPINGDTFIFKSTDKAHIRIVYTFKLIGGDIGQLTLYDVKRGDFDHSAYIKEFNKKFKNPRDWEFVNIALPKLRR